MKRWYWLALIALAALPARAQYDAALGHYWALQPYYNMAATGLSGQIDVHGLYSMQLSGFEHNPSTMLVAADMPLFFIGPAHGAGLGFMNDNIGLFSNKEIYLQYAYHQKLWGGRLSAGLRLSILNNSFDGSKLDLEDTGDPAFIQSQVSGTAFDLGFGLRYTYKDRWYAGLSALHLMNPTIKLGDEKRQEEQVSGSYYLTGGYTFRFREPTIKLYTTAIVRTDFQQWRADLTARLAYSGPKHKLYAGVGYSPTNSVTVLLGLNFHGVDIGYSYEAYTSGIGALHGAHEIVVGYQTDLNLFKKGKNRHQSIRIL